MESLKYEDIEPWLLSGKPVVRLAGKDFEQPLAHYTDWLRSLCATLELGLSLRQISDPPGVVIQTYVPGDDVTAPVLVDPLIKVSKGTCGWLYCIYPKCRIRLAEGFYGVPCAAHEGK